MRTAGRRRYPNNIHRWMRYPVCNTFIGNTPILYMRILLDPVGTYTIRCIWSSTDPLRAEGGNPYWQGHRASRVLLHN